MTGSLVPARKRSAGGWRAGEGFAWRQDLAGRFLFLDPNPLLPGHWSSLLFRATGCVPEGPLCCYPRLRLQAITRTDFFRRQELEVIHRRTTDYGWMRAAA